MSKTKSILTTHPDLAKEWSEKNAFGPNEITFGSTKKVWWQCAKDEEHLWKESPNKRTHGRGCPYCAGKRVCTTNSLAYVYPQIAEEWDSERNVLNPKEVYCSTQKSYWWRCPRKDYHVYQMKVHLRTQADYSCPYCSSARLHEQDSLASTFPELSREYDPSRNKKPATKVYPKSNAAVWWRCTKHPHPENVWKATPNSRTKTSNPICPYCTGKLLSHDKSNSIKAKYPKLASSWSELNQTTPSQVTEYNRELLFLWKCDNSNHPDYTMSVKHRINGHGCPYCAGKLTANDESLGKRNPELLKEWDWHLNSISPFEILPGSTKRIHWTCTQSDDHQWVASPNNRTKSDGGTGCPHCASQSLINETELYEMTRRALVQSEVIRHFRCEWLGRMHFDIAIPEMKIAIEYHGEQHYRPISYFGGRKAFERRRMLDSHKRTLAAENGWTLIEVKYTASHSEKHDLLSRLAANRDFIEAESMFITKPC